MTTLIVVTAIVLLVGAGIGVLAGTESGRALVGRVTNRDSGITDLQEADTISTARDVGAVAPGVARNPHSLVLGYYIDSKNAVRVRRNPEANGQLVSTEPHLPTLVFGPPGSGKTTALLVPAILTFGQGNSPVLCGSVKHDLAQATIKLRSKVGKAQIFDPTGQTPANLRKYTAKWTPLAAATTWRGANETAASMVFASDEGGAGDKFWAGQSVSLLSVLLFVTAGTPGSSMQDVSKLLGELLLSTSEKPKSSEEGASTAAGGGSGGAAPAAEEESRGFESVLSTIDKRIHDLETNIAQSEKESKLGQAHGREIENKIAHDRAKLDEYKAARESILPHIAVAKSAPPTAGGVLASCSNVLQVYRYARDYANVPWDDPDIINIDDFLSGANTVYLCAPPRNLSLYAPLLSAFAAAVIARAYEIGQARTDGRLPQGLLLAIDEYAAMPLSDLPALFATGRSYGLSFLVAAQDLSQIVHKNGEALARSLLSSSACIAVLSRAKDPYTIETISKIAGEVKVSSLSYTRGTSKSKSRGEDSGRQEGTTESVTESHEYRPLLPPGKISTFDSQEAFAIVGNQRCQLLLRPHYSTEILQRLADGDTSALAEENSYHNVKKDLPSQPNEDLVDMSTPLPPEQDHMRRRRQPVDA